MTCLANVTGKTPDQVNAELGKSVKPTGGLKPNLSDAVAEKLGFKYAKEIKLNETDIMTNGLCAGNPVLVRVKSPSGGPEHWVAITGQITNAATGACDDYSISDPANYHTRLSEYVKAGSITGIFVLFSQ